MGQESKTTEQLYAETLARYAKQQPAYFLEMVGMRPAIGAPELHIGRTVELDSSAVDVRVRIPDHVPAEAAAMVLESMAAHLRSFPETVKYAQPPEVRPDWLGLCPYCHDIDALLNVEREHYAVCHAHKLHWVVGSNLFCSLPNEDAGVWEANRQLLDSYQAVEPFRYQRVS
jgi:hypothetical protein